MLHLATHWQLYFQVEDITFESYLLQSISKSICLWEFWTHKHTLHTLNSEEADLRGQSLMLEKKGWTLHSVVVYYVLFITDVLCQV